MKFLLILFLSFLLVDAIAQQNQQTIYLKFDGSIVSSKDSADFIRYIQEPKEGERGFDMIETYRDGSKKRFGKIVRNGVNLIFGEGSVISYYPNGNRESIINFSHGQPLGDWLYYYPNGQLKEATNYYFTNFDTYRKKTTFVADSSGKEFLDKNGTGNVLINDLDGVTTSGQYKKGLKEGLWITNDKVKKVRFEESYKNGNLLLGTRIDDFNQRVTYTYKLFKTKPTFSKIIPDDNIQLDYRLADIEKKHIDKKGIVVVLFDVSENGEVKNKMIYQSLSPASDQDALKVVESKSWKPATDHGKPIYYKSHSILFVYK